MLSAACYVTPLTRIYRRRVLSVSGLVQCRYGDHVSSDRVIATAEIPGGYHLLDLEEGLHTRIKRMDKVLAKKIGETILAGQVLARLGGLVKKDFVSPVSGTILDARSGKVLIEVSVEHVELTALYPGKISRVVPERGAEIEITGALIQGAWGTGRELRGRLECIASDGNLPMVAEMITSSHMAVILVGGRTLDVDVLAAAAENQVAAIVVGSVDSALIPAIEASGVPVMVTEGFGDLPIGARTFDLLRQHIGSETCFSPVVQMRGRVRRPELIIALPTEGDVPAIEYDGRLEAGMRVRALRAPYAGQVGQIVSLPARPQRVESGLRTRGAVVDLDTGGRVFVPRENLEMLV